MWITPHNVQSSDMDSLFGCVSHWYGHHRLCMDAEQETEDGKIHQGAC